MHHLLLYATLLLLYATLLLLCQARLVRQLRNSLRVLAVAGQPPLARPCAARASKARSGEDLPRRMLTFEANLAPTQSRVERQLRIFNCRVAPNPSLPLQPQARGQRESWAHALTGNKENPRPAP